jgi:putative MFS transporter
MTGPKLGEVEDSIATRLDELPATHLHVAIVAVCGFGLGFDTFEMALGSALSAVFSTPPEKLSSGALSLLLSSVYIGAVIGAPLLGWWADVRGRRRILAAVLIWVGLASLAAARSKSALELTVFRSISGVGLGAYPPIMMAYLTDVLPPRRRGMLVFTVSAMAVLGIPASVFLVRALLPIRPLGIEAWRWGFICGGAGAAAIGAAFSVLPESPRWLAERGRDTEADQAFRRFGSSKAIAWLSSSKSSILVPEKKAGQPVMRAPGVLRSLQLGALFLLAPWSTNAFPLLSGAVLAAKGLKLTDTLLYLGFSMLGPFLGSIALAPVVDRIERRITLATFAAAMMVTGVCFIATSAPVWMVASNLVFMMSASVYTPALSLYAAELFPTSARASASAAGWALNRVGAACSPLLLLPLLRSRGAMPMFAVIAATLVASVLLLAVAPRGNQGHSLA